MNRLDFFTGGHPFSTDDITFLQAAARDGFKFSLDYGPAYIFSGCELQGNTSGLPVTCTEGYIAYKGEIMYVPAHQVVADYDDLIIIDLRWEPYEETDATYSPRVYADSNNRNVHIKRMARVVDVSVVGVDNTFYNPKKDFIYLSNGWQAGTNTVPTPYYRMEAGRIHLYGDIHLDATPTSPNSPFMQINEGLRPEENQQFIVLTSDIWDGTFNITNPDYTWIRVDTDGKCWANQTVGAATSINLSGISWRIHH
ncbi:MAG: hypothetical protein F9K23_00625 [Bacteroidetes bacterium]|nr:MAG: hypothetical protein F9K23_00625 [Bacteroidota bacterium]